MNTRWFAYDPETDRVDWKKTQENIEAEIIERANRDGWRPSEAAAALADVKLSVIPKIKQRYYYLRRRSRR